MAKNVQGSRTWFIQQRTRSLAVVYLTRRDDLLISESTDFGIDLEVVIKTRMEVANRKFGVILRGALHHSSASHLNSHLKARLETLGDRPFPYPVCLFHFVMENDTAYYTWVAEPSVTADGHPVLQSRHTATFVELDTPAIDSIVVSVNAWYDAFYANVIEGINGYSKRSGIAVLHAVIDGEAGYFSEHGAPPRLLKLPVLQAYELAKLGREHLGELSGHIIKNGIRVLEKDGLLGMKVKLVTDQQEFSFE